MLMSHTTERICLSHNSLPVSLGFFLLFPFAWWPGSKNSPMMELGKKQSLFGFWVFFPIISGRLDFAVYFLCRLPNEFGFFPRGTWRTATSMWRWKCFIGTKGACNAEDIVSLWSRCWMKGEQREPRQDDCLLGALLSLWAHTFQTYSASSLLSCTIKASRQLQKSLQSKANSTHSSPFLFKFKKCLLNFVSSADSSELGPWWSIVCVWSLTD